MYQQNKAFIVANVEIPALAALFTVFRRKHTLRSLYHNLEKLLADKFSSFPHIAVQ